jgi:hypothetical protein
MKLRRGAADGVSLHAHGPGDHSPLRHAASSFGMAVRITIEGARILLCGDYEPGWVQAVRDVPGRRWHPDRRCWSVPHSGATLARLQAVCAGGQTGAQPRAPDSAGASTAPGPLAGDVPPPRPVHRPAAEPDPPCALEIAPPPRRRRAPRVLSRSEVERLFAATTDAMQRALLMLIYSAGLRPGEALRLRFADLHRARMRIRVRRADGTVDRYTILSPRALEAIRLHRLRSGARDLLFPGARPDQPLGPRRAQQIVRAAALEAGIDGAVTPATLRHSCAAHLLDAGTDARHVQALLGHASPRTVRAHLQQVRPAPASIRSPLDH